MQLAPHLTLSLRKSIDSAYSIAVDFRPPLAVHLRASRLLLLPDEPFLQEGDLCRDVALHGFTCIRVEMAARK